MPGSSNAFRRFRLRAPAAAACAAFALASAGVAAAVGPATPNGPLTLAAPVRPVKGATTVYLVQLKEPSAATYKGGTAGFAATKPAPGRKLDASSAAVSSYVQHLTSSHDRLLG